jgi:hypothetical protein
MSNARNLANLLGAGNSISVDGSITAGTELVGNVSGRILLDASAGGTDVGDEFLLDGTDVSATNAGSKILFEEGTDDGSAVMSTFFAGGGTKVSVSSEGGTVFTDVQQGLAKAWFHIISGGATTIALGDSFNATSISDGGTGIYNFNINNDMANAVYSLTVSSQAGADFPDKPQINSQAAGNFQCRQSNASAVVDSGIYNATVNGDLA